MSYFICDILEDLPKEGIRMRKTKGCLFLLCLLIIMVTLEAVAEGAVRYIVSPNGKTVNIRSGPGKNYKVVTAVKSGTQVEFIEDQDEWVEVQYKGKKGYVDAVYVTDAAPTAKATSTPKPTDSSMGTLGYVTSENGKPVKLRSGPGKTYREVGEAEVGKDVTILTKGKTWSKIRIDGEECYLMSKFLSSTKPSITPAPATATPVAETVTKTAYVVSTNGGPVRVRKGAGTSYKVVGELGYGVPVQVDGTKGKWSHISTDTVTGYIQTSFLTSTKPEPYATATPKPETVISEKAYVTSKNGKAVNVRKSGKSNASVVAALDVGTEVTVTQRGNKWSQITGDFGTGYILNQYLSSQKPEITPVPTDAGSDSYQAYVYSSNGKAVRMRAKASSSAKTVAILDVGTEVMVLGETGNWYKISTGSKEGYMVKSYISETKPVNDEDAKVSIVWVPGVGSKVYVASASNGVVRTYTSPESKKADGKAYPVGTPATVKEVEDGWVKISISGQESYLRVSSLSASAAAAIPGSKNRLINYLKSSGGMVEVRRAKFQGSGTLGNFLTGTAVIVLSKNVDEGWAYIQVGTTKGYIDLTNLNKKP